jgi:hypothetical protein
LNENEKALEAQIISLYANFDSQESEALKMIETEQDMIKRLEQDKIEMAESRKDDIEINKTMNKRNYKKTIL